MSYLGTLYIVHLHLCCKEIFRSEKRYLDLKMVIFSVLKSGFNGYTFDARDYNTNGIFHFR